MTHERITGTCTAQCARSEGAERTGPHTTEAERRDGTTEQKAVRPQQDNAVRKHIRRSRSRAAGRNTPIRLDQR